MSLKTDTLTPEFLETSQLGLDLETTCLYGGSPDPHRDRVLLISLSDGSETFVIEPGPWLNMLFERLDDGSMIVVVHNAEFDLRFLEALGYDGHVANLWDTMIVEQLLTAGWGERVGLGPTVWRRLSRQIDKTLQKSFIDHRGDFTPEQIEYSRRDAEVLPELMKVQKERCRQEGLMDVADLENSLVSIVADMEWRGVGFDSGAWEALKVKELSNAEEAEYMLAVLLELPIYQLNLFGDGVSSGINFNSPQQVQSALSKAGINVSDTREDTLVKYAKKHPKSRAVLDSFIKYKKCMKRIGFGYDRYVNPTTGRIHTHYMQCRACTGRFSCVSGNTKVNTQKGVVPINIVEVDDFVRTPVGMRRVTAVACVGKKPVVVIKLSNGIVLRCSPEHHLRSKGTWVQADTVKIGDPLYMSFTPGKFGCSIKLPNIRPPKLPHEWTVDLAEFVGYFLADGWTSYSNYNGKPVKVSLSFGWEDGELLQYMQRHIYNLFGKRVAKHITKSCPTLGVSSIDVGGMLAQIGVSGKSGDIRVPPGIFNTPKEIVAGFLRGYFEGDGHVGHGQLSVRSTSYNMLSDVQQLLISFGIPSTIHSGSPDTRGYAPRHTLCVLGDRSKRIFKDHIGFLTKRKSSKLAQIVEQPKNNSTAERIILYDGFDISILQSTIYDYYRLSNGHAPANATTFTYRMRKGRKYITLSRAEWVMKSLGSSVESPEAQYLKELVDGQYYEVCVCNISHEEPVPMYDIEVDGGQYIAQGVLVHNSTQPNLQNVPKSQDYRSLFVAAPGCVLVTADYSQQEMRILAYMAKDKTLKRMCMEEDIHLAIARKMYDDPNIEKSDVRRSLAKGAGLGMAYGAGVDTIAQTFGISHAAAEKIVSFVREAFPAVTKWAKERHRQVMSDGWVKTLSGRKRWFPPSQEGNNWATESRNAPIQGSAADIMKLAMIYVNNALRKGGYKAKIVLTVHDELVVETPEEEARDVAQIVELEMMRAGEHYVLDIPMPVDIVTAKDWKK